MVHDDEAMIQTVVLKFAPPAADTILFRLKVVEVRKSARQSDRERKRARASAGESESEREKACARESAVHIHIHNNTTCLQTYQPSSRI